LCVLINTSIIPKNVGAKYIDMLIYANGIIVSLSDDKTIRFWNYYIGPYAKESLSSL
jgi:hypothetical protein